MPMPMRTSSLAALLLIALPGCEGEGEKLARAHEEQARELRHQTERLVDLQADVAQSAAQLVESDARARADWVALHSDLESQRLTIGQQRDQLEIDRREIAAQRLTESLLGDILSQASLLIACSLPLVICWMLLRRANTDEGAEVVCDALLDDLSAARPRLLAPPENIGGPD